MFRGVLYRHLREAGTKFGYVIGVAFAALMSSFVFAVIHPQGLFGIPILMGLAVVFALAREWRGTIFPAMIAHALVNAGTSTVLLLIAD
jgi:membrane protease YdiL (CAAX protease family)